MKFSSMVLFSVLWGTIVYCPVAHWVWSDAAGVRSSTRRLGIARLISRGDGVSHHFRFSALVCSVLLGQRLGFRQEPMPPHNLHLHGCWSPRCCGWVGLASMRVCWRGEFSSGKCPRRDTSGGLPPAGLRGAIAEWIARGTPSVLGACSGAVAGLVCVTPASGSATPVGGALMGIAADSPASMPVPR